jgi:linoleoyl-CoA desaturase
MERVAFSRNQVFLKAVRKSVNDYFREQAIAIKGGRSLYIKAALSIPIAIGLYALILFGHYSDWTGLLLCVALGLVLAFVAVNIMHDACHGSYSDRSGINYFLGLSMNAVGSNAFLWKIRHNVLHHTYTNIDGIDHDIANWPMLRQSEAQTRKPIHRFQHIYMFGLYAVTTLYWIFIQDFQKYFSRTIPPSTPIKFDVREQIIFWITKGFYFFFFVILPIIFFGWIAWLVGFVVMHFAMSLGLITIFQLSHLVELTAIASSESTKLDEIEWAVHELMTTSNYATASKLVTWLVGGLNFQIEHHLFPNVSHIHYFAISRIVRETCREFNLPYNEYPSVFSAIRSHIRHMRNLGRINQLHPECELSDRQAHEPSS